jgi:GH25 family lysozyme M1 (1,4-beta-N-acetylmuramidase)
MDEMKKIVDISHHQGDIDWDEFAKDVDLVIIRVQDGSGTIDRRCKEYVAEAKKHKIPFGHYAFTRFDSVEDAKKEARDFYARGDKSALFWVADVEVKTTNDMAGATQAYVNELRKLGAKKVGAYFAHHGYQPWDLDKVKVDFKWFPRYGANDGKQHEKPDYACELWQYTSSGSVAGVKGNIDLNVLVGERKLDWFTDEPKPKAVKHPLPHGIIRKGNEGNHVKQLQAALNASGHKAGSVDGDFGPKTEAAVRKFQDKHDLKVDGIYGPKTKAKLAEVLK